MDPYQVALSIALGVGLSAACGFRVFIPLLAMGIASRAGALQLASGFDWMQTNTAIVAFGTASVLEIGGYYIPWLDNLLDSIATPAAGIAGAIATASVVAINDPLLQWGLGIIAGGGTALGVQALTVGTRAMSTLTTGGLGNPVVATIEATASTALTLLAIIVPLIAVGLVLLLAVALAKLVNRWRSGRATRSGEMTSAPPQLPAGA